MPVSFTSATTEPSFYHLDNGLIRIGGNGSGESSITSFGGLRGPQYFNQSQNTWYNLTIGNSDMANAFGVGGAGTDNWNIDGSINLNSVQNVALDTSGFVTVGTRGTGVYGYGTIVATGTMTLNSRTIQVSHSYTLGESTQYLSARTTLTNLSASTATNLRSWIGVRDDWLGNYDSVTKQRGTLTTTTFVQSETSSQRSPAIKITTPYEGALFFSTSSRANTAISGCCSFSNAYSTNPLTNATSLTNDGSYALFVRMNDLASNESDSFSWYYAAGDTSDLAAAIGEVAREAASWTDQTVEVLAPRGEQYSDSVLASGEGVITYSEIAPSGSISSAQTSGLPPFLELNSSTGAITGTAPNDSSADGVYVFRIRATDVVGETATTANTANLTITVGAPPSIADVTYTNSGVFGEALSSFSFADTTGYPAPTYSRTSGALPNGVTLGSNTGELSGTPTEFGEFPFTVTATNAFGSSTTTLSLLTVNRAAYFPGGYSNLDSVTFENDVDSPYSSRITAAGYPAPVYSIVDDPLTAGTSNLPPGLSLNATTGRITGVATSAGSYPFRVFAENGRGNGDTTSTQTIVVATVPTVTFDDIATDAYLGIAFNQRPTFSGYPTPAYSVTGSLPNGVTLKSDGAVSGTPTEAGTFSFRVCAKTFGAQTCTRLYALRVFAEPVYRNNNELPPTAEFGVPYSGHLNFHGLVENYAIAAQSGGLPQGLSIGSTTGIIGGTPTQTGVFQFRVTARGSTGQSSTTPDQTLTVNRVPVWIRQTLGGLTRTPINTQVDSFVSAVGFPDPTYSISSGVLPRGISLNAESGELLGRPTQHGSFAFTIAASNAVGHVTSAPISLMVTQNPIPMDEVVVPTVLRNIPFADAIVYDAYPEPTYSIATGALPPGLAISSSSGAITGSATALGEFNFAVAATAPNFYNHVSPLMKLAVQQIPIPQDRSIVSKTNLGVAYADGVFAESFPLASYALSEGSMPEGFTVNPRSGEITGTPTVTGEYSFTVTARNIIGAAPMPIALSVLQPPTKPILTLAPSALVGSVVNGFTASEGYPLPTFFVASGSLPPGVTLNKTTGKISGSPTAAGSFSFTIGAVSTSGSNTSSIANFDVLDPGANFEINASIGDEFAEAAISVQSEGMMPNVSYKVVVRSTPQTVASGTTTWSGAIFANFTIPDGLEPGWHSITLTTQAADGSEFEEVSWFEITANGILETLSDTQPSAAEMASALTDDDAFFESIGVDPESQVSEEAVQETVTEVTSVVASVALVSAAAAATAAVASASAAAAAASSAGAAAGAAGSAAGSAAGGTGSGSSSSSSSGARTAGAGGGPSGSGGSSGGGGSGGGGSGGGARGGSTGGSTGGSSGGSSGGGSSNSSTGGSSGDGGDDAEYGSLEVEHDDFTTTHTSWGDALAWWSLPLMTWLDTRSVAAIQWTSRYSPVLSRIINDGSYLRSMVGSLMGILYIAAIAVGILAVTPGAEKMALSGSVVLLTAIVVFGTVDALAGILGMSAFTIATLMYYPVTDLADVRYLLAMFISGFAPIILSTTFRKIRRPHMEKPMDVWERVVDVFMIAFIASLTTLSLIGGIASYAGASVPLAENANTIVLLVTGVAVARIVLEELAARGFGARLDRINPTEIAGPPLAQQWVSLVFKYAVLVIMIGDMVGWGWWLWLGSFVMFVPGILGMTFSDLPKSKLLSQIIPGGLAALLLATLLAGWSSDLVGLFFADTPMYGQLSFLLVPLPVIITAIVGMFADGSEKWYVQRKLTSVYLIGGVGIFVSTILATDFVGQILGS